LTDRRAKGNEVLAPSIFSKSWPKGEPQKVEFLIGITSTPVCILAVNNLCLLRVKFQIALPQSFSNTRFQILRFRFGYAVHNDVIRVALESDFRVFPSHPVIKGIVQKEIGQKWAIDSSHAIDNFEFEQTVRYARGWNKNSA
jgi:hypothetical protein